MALGWLAPVVIVVRGAMHLCERGSGTWKSKFYVEEVNVLTVLGIQTRTEAVDRCM